MLEVPVAQENKAWSIRVRGMPKMLRVQVLARRPLQLLYNMQPKHAALRLQGPDSEEEPLHHMHSTKS
jgi:hypothetical protein